MPVNTKSFSYPSADGKNEIFAVKYWDDVHKPIGALQIAHGMAEHIARYEDFAHYMVGRGFVVYGANHLGHGPTAQKEDLGFFAQNNGDAVVVADMAALTKIICEENAKLPIFLMGHSMGSIFARVYAAKYSDLVNGVIFMGTSGPNPAAGVGVKLVSGVVAAKGARAHSKMVDGLFAFNKIKNPRTEFDWLSFDEEQVNKYIADPLCGFKFTVSAYRDVLVAMNFVSTQAWANGLTKNMPVLLVSGKEDPVGNFGAGVEAVDALLKNAGVEDVTLMLFENARHEVLNEVNRNNYYKEIGNWLAKYTDSEFFCTCNSTTLKRSSQCAHCSF